MRDFALDRSLRRSLTCWMLNALDTLATKLGAPPVAPAWPGQDLEENSACIQFAAFRHTLDLLLADKRPIRSWGREFTRPEDYVYFMLPGLDIRAEVQTTTEQVNPDYVIGCPWKSHPPATDPNQLMNRLNAAVPGSTDRAEYNRLATGATGADLPLYVAHEGKNRVSLFQQHQRTITADVRRERPHRQVTVRRDLLGRRWLACWINENKVEICATIPFPEVALPIYHLLGAEISTRRMATEPQDVEISREQSLTLLAGATAIA